MLRIFMALFGIALLAFIFTQTDFLKGASYGSTYYVKIELTDTSGNVLDDFTSANFSSSATGSRVTTASLNSSDVYLLTLNSSSSTDITISKEGFVSESVTVYPASTRPSARTYEVYYDYGYYFQHRRRVSPGEGGGATYEQIEGGTVTLSSGSESVTCTEVYGGYHGCPLSTSISSAPTYTMEAEGYETVEGTLDSYRTSNSDSYIREEVYTTLSTTLDFTFSSDPSYDEETDSYTVTLNAIGLDSTEFDSSQTMQVDFHLQGYDSTSTYVSLHHAEEIAGTDLVEGDQDIVVENVTNSLDIYEGGNYDLTVKADYGTSFEESDETNNSEGLNYDHPAYEMEIELSYDSSTGEVSAETCMNLLNENYDPVFLNNFVEDSTGTLVAEDIELSMQRTGDCETNVLYTISADNEYGISVDATIVNYANNYIESDTSNNSDSLRVGTSEFPTFESDDDSDSDSDSDEDEEDPLCNDLDIDPNTYEHDSDDPIDDLHFDVDLDVDEGWAGTLIVTSANDAQFTYEGADGDELTEEDSLSLVLTDERQNVDFLFEGDVNDEVYAYIEGEESRCNDTLTTERAEDDDEENDDDEEDDEDEDESEYTHPFLDVIDHWAEEFVDEAYNNGWIDGRTPTYFEPHDDITIAEFIKILLESNDEEPSNGDSGFWFVNTYDWALGYIVRAEELDVVRTRDGLVSNFGLPITRCDAALYIARYKGIEYYLEDDEIAFDDVDVSGDHAHCAYAVHALSESYVDTDEGEEAVIEGYGNDEFRPNNYIDRAEALTMLLKAMQL